MGITERHLFENEEPELTERQLEDAVSIQDRVDVPEVTTIKMKRQIMIKAIRCIACGNWECPEYDREKYEAIIAGEALGLCESCRNAIEWAKKKMEGR